MENKEIISVLPERLKKPITNVFSGSSAVNEIRLRAGKPIMIIEANDSYFIDENGKKSNILSGREIEVSEAEITDTFHRLCHFSVYSFEQSINNGYITLKGGNRVGIAGSAVVKNGSVTALKEISSLSFRVARSIHSCADEVLRLIYEKELMSTLIIGAPSSGKTTILREICRKISSGYNGKYLKCTVVDEREEIASLNGGIPLMDVGINTDVLSSFPKADGIIIALRTLSPSVIFLDEIGTFEEAKSISEGLNSGVKFIASAHSSSLSEALERPQIKEMAESGAFDCMLLLGRNENLGKVMDFKKL